jgi:hypothetical protein
MINKNCMTLILTVIFTLLLISGSISSRLMTSGSTSSSSLRAFYPVVLQTALADDGSSSNSGSGDNSGSSNSGSGDNSGSSNSGSGDNSGSSNSGSGDNSGSSNSGMSPSNGSESSSTQNCRAGTISAGEGMCANDPSALTTQTSAVSGAESDNSLRSSNSGESGTATTSPSSKSASSNITNTPSTNTNGDAKKSECTTVLDHCLAPTITPKTISSADNGNHSEQSANPTASNSQQSRCSSEVEFKDFGCLQQKLKPLTQSTGPAVSDLPTALKDNKTTAGLASTTPTTNSLPYYNDDGVLTKDNKNTTAGLASTAPTTSSLPSDKPLSSVLQQQCPSTGVEFKDFYCQQENHKFTPLTQTQKPGITSQAWMDANKTTAVPASSAPITSSLSADGECPPTVEVGCGVPVSNPSNPALPGVRAIPTQPGSSGSADHPIVEALCLEDTSCSGIGDCQPGLYVNCVTTNSGGQGDSECSGWWIFTTCSPSPEVLKKLWCNNPLLPIYINCKPPAVNSPPTARSAPAHLPATPPTCDSEGKCAYIATPPTNDGNLVASPPATPAPPPPPINWGKVSPTLTRPGVVTYAPPRVVLNTPDEVSKGCDPWEDSNCPFSEDDLKKMAQEALQNKGNQQQQPTPDKNVGFFDLAKCVINPNTCNVPIKDLQDYADNLSERAGDTTDWDLFIKESLEMLNSGQGPSDLPPGLEDFINNVLKQLESDPCDPHLRLLFPTTPEGCINT